MGQAWFIGAPAQHSASTARLLAYVAGNGRQGICLPTDFKVTAQSTPNGTVGVAPGAATVLCAWEAAAAYATKNTTSVTQPITATGGAARSDMIVLSVEDSTVPGSPHAAPSNPSDPATSWSAIRVIEGVTPGATTVPVGSNLSAIPLARIDIPASTGTITQSMITDLRVMANPRRHTVMKQYVLNSGADYTAASATPMSRPLTTVVPSWANRCSAFANITNLMTKSQGAASNSHLGQHFLGFGTNATVPGLIHNPPSISYFVSGMANQHMLNSLTVALEDFTIPVASRGQSRTFAHYVWRTSGAGYFSEWGSDATIVWNVTFTEAPE